ncbi:MAG: glycosyltransferase family 2 protein [bacterium]
MSRPLVLIQIVNYNGLNLTGHMFTGCLDSIKKQTYRNTLVHIIDNNSDDGSIEFIKQNYPGFRITRLSRNAGYISNNAGLPVIEKHSPQYILLINNDIILDSDFIEEMVEYMDSNPKTGVSSGILHFADKPDYFNSTGIMMNKTGFTGNRNFNTPVVLGISGESIVSVSGGCMFIRREVIESIGLFDSMFGSYYEDIDFSLRMLTRTDYTLSVNPRASGFHRPSSSWQYFTRKKDYLILRNQYMIMLKLFPLYILIPAFAYLLRTRIFKRNIMHMLILANLFVLSPVILFKRMLHAVRSHSDISRYLVDSYRPFEVEEKKNEYAAVMDMPHEDIELPERIIMGINDNYIGRGFSFLSEDYPKGRYINKSARIFLHNNNATYIKVHGEGNGNGMLTVNSREFTVEGQFSIYISNESTSDAAQVDIQSNDRIKIIEIGLVDEKL